MVFVVYPVGRADSPRNCFEINRFFTTSAKVFDSFNQKFKIITVVSNESVLILLELLSKELLQGLECHGVGIVVCLQRFLGHWGFL